jgi:hypothetical protein
MANKKGLEAIGLMLGTATLLVALIGTAVVGANLTGKLHFDDAVPAAEMSAAIH